MPHSSKTKNSEKSIFSFRIKLLRHKEKNRFKPMGFFTDHRNISALRKLDFGPRGLRLFNRNARKKSLNESQLKKKEIILEKVLRNMIRDSKF